MTQQVNGLLIENIKLAYKQNIKNWIFSDITMGALEDTGRVVKDDEHQSLEEFADHVMLMIF